MTFWTFMIGFGVLWAIAIAAEITWYWWRDRMDRRSETDATARASAGPD